MNEFGIIDYVNKNYKRHPGQKNFVWESDAEIIDLHGRSYAFSIDDYSPEEDMFPDHDPETLGYNLVIATVSDVISCGGNPEFFMHSIVLPKGKGPVYYQGMLNGIKNGLEKSSTFMIGGDTSFSDDWRYSAVVFGEVERPIMRSGINPGDIIYATGKFGMGNRFAFLKHLIKKGKIKWNELVKDMLSDRFKSRCLEAEIIRKYAGFCIDSSDGYFNSFRYFNMVNPEVRLIMRIDPNLVDDKTKVFANMMGVMPEVSLFSSAGEYELIFGIPEKVVPSFEAEMGKMKHDFYKIGRAEQGEGLFAEINGTKTRKIDRDPPDPRGDDIEKYLENIMVFVKDYAFGSA